MFMPLLLLCMVFLTTGCSLGRQTLAWRVKDVVLTQTPALSLQGHDEQIIVTLPTKTLQQMMLAHIRIGRSANVQAELFIVDGEDPNAFAGLHAGQRIIGIKVGMVKLIGDDADEYAALIGHEAAHWAKGHVDSGQVRTNTLNAVGTLVGAGLGMAGVPVGGLIAGLGVDLIDTSYSREQEREADAQSLEYMSVNGYDPRAAVKLHEKMHSAGGGFRLPFLSSHPSGDERIENLRALIDAKLAPSRAAPALASEIESANQR